MLWAQGSDEGCLPTGLEVGSAGCVSSRRTHADPGLDRRENDKLPALKSDNWEAGVVLGETPGNN